MKQFFYDLMHFMVFVIAICILHSLFGFEVSLFTVLTFILYDLYEIKKRISK